MNSIETGSILTGNRLRDGAVVYLDRTGNWTTTIHTAAVALEKNAEAALLRHGEAAVRNNLVTEAYLVSVTREDGTVTPSVASRAN
jgi:hypothetical protein